MNLVIKKSVSFGVLRVYPMCEKSKLLAELSNKKTFTMREISLLQKLGYNFVCENNNQENNFDF